MSGLVIEQYSKVHQANSAYQKSAVRDRRKASDKIANTCQKLSGDDFRACISDEIEANYTDQATNEGLQVQKDMALWAFWMFVVSAFMAGLTTVGVWFIYKTLEATRDTLNEAGKTTAAANKTNEIMYAERRPWVTIRREINAILTLRTLEGEAKKAGYSCVGFLRWQFHPENVGNSPAFGFYTKQNLACVASFEEARSGLNNFVDSVDVDWQTKSESTIFPGETALFRESEVSSALTLTPSNGNYLVLYHGIFYRSQESDISGVEARVLFVEFDKSQLGPWTVKLLEMGRDRITR